MSDQERESYKEINKPFFEITEVNGTKQVLLRENETAEELNFQNSFYLRNNESLVTLYKFFKNANRHLFNISIFGESKPINCSIFFCKKSRSSDFENNYDDTMIYQYCTVLENFINPELKSYSRINENFLNSFPNSECVIDYYNPKYKDVLYFLNKI
jgi:hypothetical protein